MKVKQPEMLSLEKGLASEFACSIPLGNFAYLEGFRPGFPFYDLCFQCCFESPLENVWESTS